MVRSSQVDVYGIVFVLSIGLLREAIDNHRLPSPMAVGDLGVPPLESVFSGGSRHGGGGGGGGGSGGLGYRVYALNPAESTGRLADETTEWAVWTDEYFERRRYGFPTEAAAREAMDTWYCVRILTRQEEEVSSRQRWHSEALLAIRDTIRSNSEAQSETST
jgi:hypothetical protein